MKNNLICVLGGTGFVGSRLVSRLYNLGYRVRVLTRNKQRHRDLLVLPRIELVQVESLDLANLTEQFQGCAAVVNLIGILNGNAQDFQAVHVDLPTRVVNACAAAGVKRYLHMSALNADANQGPSVYLKSKGAGEVAVFTEGAAQGVDVSALRPSVIFGTGDNFFNRFAGLLRLLLVLPLACPSTRFSPVYVEDVVDAFVKLLDNPASVGQSYELVGPRTYTLKELVEYTRQSLGVCRVIYPLSDAGSRLQARIMGLVPGPEKPFSLDNYLSLQVDSVAHGENGLQQLGVVPTPVESIMGPYLSGQLGKLRYDSFRRAAGRD